ncbi:MAG: DNA polymerase III subunit delta' [Clostridia bacterium]|nr:DNA polymerase III subunit delta' [Clostridia bacterium]
MRFPLVGNDRVRGAIDNMLISGKIPHAVLIEGEEGLGKTTLARYLCKAILCEGEERPCENCAGCRLFESGNHPDMESVEPIKDRKTVSVDQVRDIVTSAAIVPQKAAKRVFLIDNAELLTVQAQNALLKILEEPPETVVFVLTCRSRAMLLQTVISRCSVLILASPDEQTAADCICSVSKRDREEILSAYRSSGGSIGLALNILKKKSASAAEDTAKEFISILKGGNQYEMLKLLFPLEKDRVKTAAFYGALEVILVSLIKDSSSATLVRRYERLYNTVQEHKVLLKSNANLSLLLTALSAAAMTER